MMWKSVGNAVRIDECPCVPSFLMLAGLGNAPLWVRVQCVRSDVSDVSKQRACLCSPISGDCHLCS